MAKLFPMDKMLELLRQSFPGFQLEDLARADVPTRQQLLLREADRLLQPMNRAMCNAFLARFNVNDQNPLYDDDTLNGLSPELDAEVGFYIELEEILHDLTGKSLRYIPEAIEAQLPAGEHTFSVDDDDLLSFISVPTYPYLSHNLLLNLAQQMLDEQTGVNPVLQDKLSTNMDLYWNGYQKETDLPALTEDMIMLLYRIYDHLEIGRRLCGDGKSLAIYDALRGYLFENFDPRTLDMALELRPWMDSHHGTLRQELPGKLDELAQKHRIMLSNSHLTCNYLLHEIEGLEWLPNELDIPDEN